MGLGSPCTRRDFVERALLATAAVAGVRARAQTTPSRAAATPVIDITDLYHPAQDPGDNFDLVAAYGLPEVDLRAVILDVTERYRHDVPRDAGYIPVMQLNALFDRRVPCAAASSRPLRALDDAAEDGPGIQQWGVELLLDTLRLAEAPVDIVSFGSARPLAIALNREPELLLAKTCLVHLCAGSCDTGPLEWEWSDLEWNVDLDPLAFIRILRSDLPIALYPCATAQGPFSYGAHNCYYRLEDLRFIRDLPRGLRQYLLYALSASGRVDFLRVLEEEPEADVLDAVCARGHHVWETAVWAQVANRRIAQSPGGPWRLTPASEVGDDHHLLPNELLPCEWEIDDRAWLRWQPVAGETRRWMYDRGDPMANEAALREALPALYRSFGEALDSP